METKEVTIGSKKLRIRKIPCIPGVELMAKCAPIVDIARWNEIDVDMVTKLAAYAEINIADEWQALDNQEICLAFLSTDELWLTAQEVYVFSFAFFITGGIRSIMEPLIRARAQKEVAKA